MADSTLGNAPILLFGMPRSGTTWLAKLFDSQPETLYRHEPDSFGRLNFLPAAPEAGDAPAWAPRVRQFFAGLPELRDTKVACSRPIFAKSYEPLPIAAWNHAATGLSLLLARGLGEIRAPLWIGADSFYEARLVGKSIESIARLGVIARSLPEARIILILRHPLAFVASMLRGKRSRAFTDSDAIGDDLGILEPLVESAVGARHGIGLDELGRLEPEYRLVWHWVLANDKAILDTHGLDNVAVIRYEDLCADAEGEIERLFDWCDLAVTPQTRRFLERSTSVDTGRYYGVFKNPRRTSNAWRRELPDELRHGARSILEGSVAAERFDC